MLASACADERGRDSGVLSSDPVCRESRALIAAPSKHFRGKVKGISTDSNIVFEFENL